jgi:hypothetical protein
MWTRECSPEISPRTRAEKERGFGVETLTTPRGLLVCKECGDLHKNRCIVSLKDSLSESIMPAKR